MKKFNSDQLSPLHNQKLKFVRYIILKRILGVPFLVTLAINRIRFNPNNTALIELHTLERYCIAKEPKKPATTH